MLNNKNLNNALFNTLGENIKHPILIFDRQGNILFFNSLAKKIFPSIVIQQNIFEILDKQSSETLKLLFKRLFDEDEKLTENIQLKLITGEELKAKISLNLFTDEDETHIFCSIIPTQNKLTINGTTRLKVNNCELNDVIKDKKILDIINDIKSLYPFTFIGKEKILNDTDKLTEIFWIEDIQDKYILVNKNLANKLGLKRTQIEGKTVKDFVPLYLLDFYQSVKNYIKKSENCILLEGISLMGASSLGTTQIIEIPLSDADNNVIAIVGIARDSNKMNKFIPSSADNIKVDLLQNFQKAVAFIDNDGNFMQGSKEFCKLFGIDFLNLEKLKYFDVFPRDVINKIQNFLSSSSRQTSFEFTGALRKTEEKPKNVNIDLSKYYSDDEHQLGFTVIIEKTIKYDNLDFLLKDRGKMFEILIQNNPEPIFIYDTENLQFLEVNKAALLLYGYTRDEFLRMDLTDL